MTKIKFYYIDEDKDIISIANEEDFKEAINAISGIIKLIATESISEAFSLLNNDSYLNTKHEKA